MYRTRQDGGRARPRAPDSAGDLDSPRACDRTVIGRLPLRYLCFAISDMSLVSCRGDVMTISHRLQRNRSGRTGYLGVLSTMLGDPAGGCRVASRSELWTIT